MLITPNRNDLQRIVVLNPKGGCGKTTLATNLASYFALRGPPPALVDCDPQGFSMRWLEKRDPRRPPIFGIAAYKNTMQATLSWQQRVPRETNRLIIDTPAAVTNPDIHELTYDASSILIPVMPSPIDIRFAAAFIADLLLVSQLDRRECQVAIVATRTRRNTRSFRQLMRFVSSLRIPVLATLRDSQNFVQAAELGIGVFELPHYKSRIDIAELVKVTSWLEQRPTPKAADDPGLAYERRDPPSQPLRH